MTIPLSENLNSDLISLNFINLYKKKKIKLNFINLCINKKNILKNFDIFKEIKKNFKNVKVISLKSIKTIRSFLEEKFFKLYLENLMYKCDSFKCSSRITLIQGFPYIEKYSYLINKLNYKIAMSINAKIIFLISIKNIEYQKKITFQLYLINNFFLKKNNFTNIGLLIQENFYNFNCINQIKKKKNKNKNFSFKTKLINRIKSYFLKKKKNFCFIDLIIFKKKYFYYSLKLLLKSLNVNFYAEIYKTEFFNDYKINKIFIFNKYLKTKKIIFNNKSLIVFSSSNVLYLNNFFSCIKKKNLKFFLLLSDNLKKFFITSKLYFYCLKNNLLFFFIKKNNICLLEKLLKFKKKKFFINYINIKKYLKLFNINLKKKLLIFLKSFSNEKFYFNKLNFKFFLKKKASEQKKKIILPEGEEPRIIKAAFLSHQLNIADCILIGNKKNIYKIASSLKLILPKSLKICSFKEIKKKVLTKYYKIFNSLNIQEKKFFLNCNIFVGCLMVSLNLVDGLVAGSIHNTSHIIRASLRCIGKKEGINLISSIFFMLFSEKVLIYADCAINPNPTSEQLSEIAIQSSDSVKNFGIFPRLAMLSYATQNSANGIMVDKVYEAIKLVKKKRPDIIIDGPIQYDAASDITISNLKYKKSILKGNANVFIFPDLNSGNITYKAVQNCGNTNSIGPIFQGLKKPINDLSRGANIEDILYTIAITAIQSYKI
ncbi:phosphate acetyltransferase [Buchnera aphidicola]|uniref:phosphate acetyltransferase n=1 Tax=Buchnera aphidicola TaxID=9 RepID=UPI003464209B